MIFLCCRRAAHEATIYLPRSELVLCRVVSCRGVKANGRLRKLELSRVFEIELSLALELELWRGVELSPPGVAFVVRLR